MQRYVPFGRHGIACDGAVYSVCVFSDRPLESVVRRGRPVWVTGKSRTSRQLLSLLCLEAYGRAPVFTETGDAASTCLLIGNEAVLGRAGLTRPTYVIDLGAWWRRHTGLPFVYARWVVRQDLDAERRQALTRWLEACTTAANEADGAARLERHAARLVGPGKLPADYYHRVHIHLNDADLAGLRLFQQRLGALAACPLSA